LINQKEVTYSCAVTPEEITAVTAVTVILTVRTTALNSSNLSNMTKSFGHKKAQVLVNKVLRLSLS
jgi:hypothetical protein